MKWVNGIKLSLSLFLLFFLAGCLRQQPEHSGMECQVGNVKRNALITPTEHVSLSRNQNFNSNLVNSVSSKSNTQFSIQDAFKQYQMLFDDVAIPIIAVPVQCNNEPSSIVHIVYSIEMELSELLVFLKDQMLQYGWQQTIAIESAECLLAFVKVDRFCTISIRPLKKDFKSSKKMQLIYFIGSQQENSA
jgi:hypothetical protein